MLPLPTVGPIEILILVVVGTLVAFGGALALRLKRMWARRWNAWLGRRGKDS